MKPSDREKLKKNGSIAIISTILFYLFIILYWVTVFSKIRLLQINIELRFLPFFSLMAFICFGVSYGSLSINSFVYNVVYKALLRKHICIKIFSFVTETFLFQLYYRDIIQINVEVFFIIIILFLMIDLFIIKSGINNKDDLNIEIPESKLSYEEYNKYITFESKINKVYYFIIIFFSIISNIDADIDIKYLLIIYLVTLVCTGRYACLMHNKINNGKTFFKYMLISTILVIALTATIIVQIFYIHNSEIDITEIGALYAFFGCIPFANSWRFHKDIVLYKFHNNID